MPNCRQWYHLRRGVWMTSGCREGQWYKIKTLLAWSPTPGARHMLQVPLVILLHQSLPFVFCQWESCRSMLRAGSWLHMKQVCTAASYGWLYTVTVTCERCYVFQTSNDPRPTDLITAFKWVFCYICIFPLSLQKFQMRTSFKCSTEQQEKTAAKQ